MFQTEDGFVMHAVAINDNIDSRRIIRVQRYWDILRRKKAK